MIRQHFVLNSLTQWCVYKAGCQVCFPACAQDQESQRLLRGMELMYQVLRKTSNTERLMEGRFYYGHALPRLQSFYHNTTTDALLWDYPLANRWLGLEDHCYIATPEFITGATLVAGGIPIFQAPTLSVVQPHTDDTKTRMLQFLYDYYGFTRVYQFYQTGVLRPVLASLVQLKGYSFPQAFAQPTFHRVVDMMTIAQCISRVPILYGEAIAIGVVLDTYFSDVPRQIRDEIQQHTCQYLGVNPSPVIHTS